MRRSYASMAPSEARCRMNYIDLNDKNDENETRTTLVKKRNYERKFEREKFDAVALQLIPNDTKKQSTMKAKKGKKAYDKLPIENLIPNLKFTERHKLDENSHPAHWLQAFVTEHMKKGDSRSVCISKWCQYTNMKAQLDFAGDEKVGGLLYKFEEFKPREIEQYISHYIAQGLNPSPQLKMKIKSQIP